MNSKSSGQCWMVGDNTLWALTVTTAVQWILKSCRRLWCLWVSYETSFLWLGVWGLLPSLTGKKATGRSWETAPLCRQPVQNTTNMTLWRTLLSSFWSPPILGFRFGPQTVNAIAKRYSSRGKISFDDYIACCVKLRALTGMLDHCFVFGLGR